jgi:hypothetical protein
LPFPRIETVSVKVAPSLPGLRLLKHTFGFRAARATPVFGRLVRSLLACRTFADRSKIDHLGHAMPRFVGQLSAFESL